MPEPACCRSKLPSFMVQYAICKLQQNPVLMPRHGTATKAVRDEDRGQLLHDPWRALSSYSTLTLSGECVTVAGVGMESLCC